MEATYTKFRRDKLHSGLWVHVRSNWWLGAGIRYSLNIWEGRICDRLGVDHVDVWGNHDGLIIGPELIYALTDIKRMKLGANKVPEGGWAIGEALSQGSVLTPLEKYEADLASGHLQVRVFEILPRVDGEDIYKVMTQAAWNWTQDVEGHGYDYWAYLGLIFRAFLDWHINTGSRTKFWCTEGAAKAYHVNPPVYNVLQDITPTPMHPEQVTMNAEFPDGLIPRPKHRKVTMKEITGTVMY